MVLLLLCVCAAWSPLLVSSLHPLRLLLLLAPPLLVLPLLLPHLPPHLLQALGGSDPLRAADVRPVQTLRSHSGNLTWLVWLVNLVNLVYCLHSNM